MSRKSIIEDCFKDNNFTEINSTKLKSFICTIVCWLTFLSLPLNLYAQNDTAIAPKDIQVSLLTCGTGEEIYSVFGHTAVRIVDSNKGTDIVYNYGTFDGYDENFETKFMQGKLLYYLSEDNYKDFIDFYGSNGRWVDEQILNTTNPEKLQIQEFLLVNALPENRAYKYDFFFDNCATRIRDIFTKTHGDAFKYPNVLPSGKSPTFRDIINLYLANNVWERFGINILLGSKIDKPMSNSEIMFLPDYLRNGVAGATLNGKAFASPAKRIVDGEKSIVTTDYSVSIVLYGLLLLLCIGIFVPKMRFLGAFMSNFILIITGLLGVLIMIMWVATDHQTCANNFNLLWALPTNLMFVFRKKQTRYAFIALVLIFVSMLLHLTHIQGLLLPEMLPLLLMLVIIFSFNFRKYNTINNAKNTVTA